MKKVVVAVKRSKWERDLKAYGSAEAVRELYRIQNNSHEKIYGSHERQARNLEILREALPEAVLAERDELDDLDLGKFDFIISLGGDNHFVYVSHFASRDTPIIGINSDPETSIGALLHFDAPGFAAGLKGDPASAEFLMEDWSRIECNLKYLDGSERKTRLCTSEISMQCNFPAFISRYWIRKGEGEWEEQKSSGMVLATGAGSTGWFRNCHWRENQAGAVFPQTAPMFKAIARELRATKSYRYQKVSVGPNDSLEIISEMDGQISVDSHPEATVPFPSGCTARFTLSDNTLKVVKGFKGKE